jgi:hypothetical protein
MKPASPGVAGGHTGSLVAGRWREIMTGDRNGQGHIDVSCAPSPLFCAAGDSTGQVMTTTGGLWTRPVRVDPAAARNLGGGATPISCTSKTFCAWIDNASNAMTYNGGSWSKPTPVAGAWALSCVSPMFCMAVGQSDAFTYDGTAWGPSKRIAGTTFSDFMDSVSCVSSSFCMAVDWKGNAFLFNGMTWTGPNRTGLDATLQNHYVGLAASAVILADAESAAPRVYFSVSCASSTFCMIVNSNGYAVEYDRMSRGKPVPIDTGNASWGLDSISCTADKFCLAVDNAGDAVTYNGSGWSIPTSTTGGGLYSVSCATSQFCAAVPNTEDPDLRLAFYTS